MRIAFYAPMKPPDDQTPSGDRTMARALLAALEAGGHTVAIASRLRLHLKTPDPAAQAAFTRRAAAEIEALSRGWPAPDLWFTYHNYHKAPDLLGPTLARRFGVPYAIAEASHAPKRAEAWGSWYAAAEHAIRVADLHLCLTSRDREGIAPLLPPGGRILDLPPFIDLDGFPPASMRERAGPVRLVTVAMMRPGDKRDSYRFLAAALATIAALDWTLAVIGDGPARADVEQAFANLPGGRIAWRGALAPADLRHCLADGQLFVWPGFGEAFGLAYLEAQAMGLPVAALDVAGVSSVVAHDRTGLLVADPTPSAYGAAIAALILDERRRIRLGRAAAAFVRTERTLERAARLLDGALRELVGP